MASLKKDNLFIREEDKRRDTPSDAAAASSIVLLLTYMPWTTQSMEIFLQLLNSVL